VVKDRKPVVKGLKDKPQMYHRPRELRHGFAIGGFYSLPKGVASIAKTSLLCNAINEPPRTLPFKLEVFFFHHSI